MTRKTVALIGYGTLSREFSRHFERVLAADYELLGALVRHVPTDASAGMSFWTSADSLLAANPDYVVEFAGVGAVAEYGERVLGSGADLVVASVGALADDALRERLADAARRSGATLHVMSGAVGGFDMLRTMALDPTTAFCVNNLKAPESIEGAPFLEGKRLSREELTEVFRGSAREAIAGFPKNVNVAVAAALAAGALDRAEVVMTSVPEKRDNTHVIEARGAMASVRLELSSSPDPSNPRSSTITAWSALALLANEASPIRFF